MGNYIITSTDEDSGALMGSWILSGVEYERLLKFLNTELAYNTLKQYVRDLNDEHLKKRIEYYESLPRRTPAEHDEIQNKIAICVDELKRRMFK